ncbi:alpha/beta hydrolase [uncultured Devosia sp.]|uniref:alpha/beta fold hydrolase n=1 Tax=uncultured Devosia sp. TaxID=211434 RepID=UPI002605A9B8|nr:alpha/beta hydrolase [uncultured Devosia sp.]
MEHHTITASDGTKLCFDLAGPQSGAGVLLCHGLCAGGAQFAADAEWLAEQGYRVLVPDLRGHGRSGMPDRVTAQAFSPQRLRADLVDMLDRAGLDRVHWVGNSLGGILGLGMAAKAPRRLASLTIFGTALALNLPSIGGLVTLLDTIPGRALAAQITAHMTTDSRTSRPLVARMLKQYDARAAAAIVGHIRRYDLREAARNWTGPGLILVGSKDHAVNRALLPQLTVLDGRPNWRIEHLPGGGHCANLDASVAWRRAILTAVAPPVAG